MTRRLRTGQILPQGGARSMFEILRASTGGYFWRLKGGNGETLCHSEVYTSKQSAQAGVDAAKRVAPLAQVRDRT
ncbi:YegP family protein [Ensifer adhaerens]